MNSKQSLLVFATLFLLLGCAKDNFDVQKMTSEETDVFALIADVEAELLAEMNVSPPAEFNGRSFGKPAYVKAGSKDALQAAVNSVGVNGKVILKSGMHYESGTVLIDKCMTLEGEDGAVLVSDVKTFQTVGFIQPAIHVNGGVYVKIRNIEMRPKGDRGGTAILLRDADFAKVYDNDIKDFQLGILMAESNLVKMYDNTVVGYDGWDTDPVGVFGIIAMSGEKTKVYGNTVSNTLFGIWGCDKKGIAYENDMSGSLLGFILCKVPQVYVMPNGDVVGSTTYASKWILKDNNAHHNYWGYLVIDGANNSYVYNNQASNNFYDIELAGDSYRFGFLTPTCKKILVAAGKYPNITVKDCGLSNQVYGGKQVDTSVDPCL